MRRLLPAVLVTSFGLGGCLLGESDPIPLRGPMPGTILVLPVRPIDLPGDVGPALLSTISHALARRGYEVIPVARGLQLLEERGLDPDKAHAVEEYAAAAREIGADAFISMRVERWDAKYAPTLVHLEHDIGYRLWDAETGGLLWELRSHGGWNWDGAGVFSDPSSDLDAYLNPSSQPRASSPYRDDADAAVLVHRFAMRRLPSRESG